MKKKILAIMMICMMAMSTASCGTAGTDNAGDSTDTTQEGSEPEAEPEETEPEDDGIIDFTTDDFTVTYVRHEFSTDYEGNKCLLYYYNYTNNSDDNKAAVVAVDIQCFQDGSECQMAIPSESNDSMDNYALNEVQPGGTVEVCQAFKLKSDTELTIEASAFISLDDAKDTQKIAVQ